MLELTVGHDSDGLYRLPVIMTPRIENPFQGSEPTIMSKQNIRIDLGNVDFGSLHTEQDFRREASRLVPKALVQLGETAGEQAWTELQKGLRGIKGMKVNNSSSDKRKFIREAGENYRKDASVADKRELEDHIVEQLKERKGAAS